MKGHLRLGIMEILTICAKHSSNAVHQQLPHEHVLHTFKNCHQSCKNETEKD